jgi:RraA family protein
MMMTFDEIKQHLAALDTASLCDANKALRVLDPGLRPIQPGLSLIGRAHTVKCHDDFLTVLRALKDAVADEVLVIDTQNSQSAVAGELFSTEAARKKLAGIIIDGACRDVRKIRALPIPVYARFTSPVAGGCAKIFETQIPVKCGSVTVRPGDILFGDDDGVLVASLEEMAAAIPKALEIQSTEARALARLAHGESLFHLINFDEHYDNVRNKKVSKLELFSQRGRALRA